MSADTIARIETFPLRIPFAAADGPPAAPRPLTSVDSLVIRVTTAQGYQGWGEALGFETTLATGRAVQDVVAPLCLGQDATRITALMRTLQQRLYDRGRAGPLMFALSALDIALWDIAGKTAGLPLHRLLGGGADDLPCYASLDRCGDPALVAGAVRHTLDAGFRAVKLHERDTAVARAARREAGPDAGLMLDVNAAWTLNQARRAAAELAELDLAWLEEPLWPPENFDGLARLRAGISIPLAAGENTTAQPDFDRLMGTGALDFIQPSPAKMGGVTELVKVFTLAAVRNVTVMPHTYYHGPGLLAAVHAMAALGDPDAMIEWRHSGLEARPYGTALVPDGGRIRVPQGAGLGLDPDPAVLRDYRLLL
jgi:L-alanine-DL-glutamate epimerase-like enolase superfamily enzyme